MVRKYLTESVTSLSQMIVVVVTAGRYDFYDHKFVAPLHILASSSQVRHTSTHETGDKNKYANGLVTSGLRANGDLS
jgi:hypothetical protein